jgi:ketosteroid isomerase-like protein
VTDPEFEAAVRATFAAFNERRFVDFATAVTDDLLESYPQSGERLEGKAQQLAMQRAWSDPPTFTIRRILHGGDLAEVEVDERYADGGLWKSVFILELRDGRIAGLTGYFGTPFPAPEWRRPFRTAP